MQNVLHFNTNTSIARQVDFQCMVPSASGPFNVPHVGRNKIKATDDVRLKGENHSVITFCSL